MQRERCRVRPVAEQPLYSRLLSVLPTLVVVRTSSQDVEDLWGGRRGLIRGVSPPSFLSPCVGYAHNSAPGGGREEGVLVFDEEEVCLPLFEGVGEVVGLGAHDVLRQAEGVCEPLQGGILTVGDVALLEGNLDLQDLRVPGQNLPGSVDLQEVGLLVFGFLDRENSDVTLTLPL